MRRRTKEILVIAIPTLLAVLAALMVSRVFVDPLIFPDTIGYLSSALKEAETLGYRAQTYGWLLVGAMRLGDVRYLVLLQVVSWIACITAATTLALRLSDSLWRALLFGILLVFSEVSMMYLLPSQWFLLTDPLYADWIALGFLLIVLSAFTRDWVIVVGALFIGIANPIRPLSIALPLAGLLIIAVLWTRTQKKNLIRDGVLSTLCVLLPSAAFSFNNRINIGTYSLSPLGGLHLSMYATALADENDTFFDDPKLNDIFRTILITGKVPPENTAWDMFYLPDSNPWHAIFQFYSWVANEPSPPKRRFRMNEISNEVAFRVFVQHPREYASMVTGRWMEILIPTHDNRYYFWHDPMTFYNNLLYASRTLESREIIFGRTDLPHIARMDERMTTWLDMSRFGIRLPKTVGSKTIILLIGATCVMVLESIRRLRSKQRRDIIIAMTILICLASTFAHSFAQALVTLIQDPRFTLPGTFTGTIAVLVTLLSLSLPHVLKKTSAGTHGRRKNS